MRPEDAERARFELRKDVLIAEFKGREALWHGVLLAIAGIVGVASVAAANSTLDGRGFGVILAGCLGACLLALHGLKRNQRGFRREAVRILLDLGRFKGGGGA